MIKRFLVPFLQHLLGFLQMLTVSSSAPIKHEREIKIDNAFGSLGCTYQGSGTCPRSNECFLLRRELFNCHLGQLNGFHLFITLHEDGIAQFKTL